MGVIRQAPITKEQQYTAVNDLRLRGILTAMADRYSDHVRALIYSCYQDDELMGIYRAIRASGDFEKGGKSKVRRKILEFPNAYVYDFVDTTMTALYGPEWAKKRQALAHELVKPWWVVSKI
jgi:hypothetical protein